MGNKSYCIVECMINRANLTVSDLLDLQSILMLFVICLTTMICFHVLVFCFAFVR